MKQVYKNAALQQDSVVSVYPVIDPSIGVIIKKNGANVFAIVTCTDTVSLSQFLVRVHYRFSFCLYNTEPKYTATLSVSTVPEHDAAQVSALPAILFSMDAERMHQFRIIVINMFNSGKAAHIRNSTTRLTLNCAVESTARLRGEVVAEMSLE